MSEFEWQFKNNDTGEVLMEGNSIKIEHEHIRENNKVDNSWRAVAISNDFVEFVRNSNGHELTVYLNDSGFSNFNIGESYNIEISGTGEEETK